MKIKIISKGVEEMEELEEIIEEVEGELIEVIREVDSIIKKIRLLKNMVSDENSFIFKLLL